MDVSMVLTKALKLLDTSNWHISLGTFPQQQNGKSDDHEASRDVRVANDETQAKRGVMERGRRDYEHQAKRSVEGKEIKERL
jgi:hypothetical protein